MQRFFKQLFTACGLAVSVMMSTSIVGQEKPAVTNTVPADEALAKSLKTWQELKTRCGGNYRYTVAFSSFAGFGNSTAIVVRNNKVVERKYREFDRNAPPAPSPEPGKAASEKWIEKDDQLGTHKEGAPPKTLDVLYDEAQKVLATKLTPSQRLYVKFDQQGLLEACFYVDTRIADDAPRIGVAISNLELDLLKE